ncbi:putative protein PLEKHA9 [Saccoglossus kowalevskii]|uniref:Pleckstrin homology domain-containing family A member 8-like n=1 Tax=Saccoglossus kowalevskii TaxID=10224 RepID=A0ABM0M742_SACKO|nr:PREDICTED: pleckstrin homology domain-containing family A member 8-like [Saccoglossus kowalevskii]
MTVWNQCKRHCYRLDSRRRLYCTSIMARRWKSLIVLCCLLASTVFILWETSHVRSPRHSMKAMHEPQVYSMQQQLTVHSGKMREKQTSGNIIYEQPENEKITGNEKYDERNRIVELPKTDIKENERNELNSDMPKKASRLVENIKKELFERKPPNKHIEVPEDYDDVEESEEAAREENRDENNNGDEERMEESEHNDGGNAESKDNVPVRDEIVEETHDGDAKENNIDVALEMDENGNHREIETFFTQVESTFGDVVLFEDPELGIQDAIPVKSFLQANEDFLPLCDHFGRAFGKARSDLVLNFERIRTRYNENPELYTNLQRLINVEFEMKEDDQVATKGIRFLKRSMEFLYQLMKYIESGIELHEAANRAYDETLLPYHNWFVQKIFRVGFIALVNRRNFLDSLAVNSKDNEDPHYDELLFKQMDKYLLDIKTILDILRKYFEDYHIET